MKVEQSYKLKGTPSNMQFIDEYIKFLLLLEKYVKEIVRYRTRLMLIKSLIIITDD